MYSYYLVKKINQYFSLNKTSSTKLHGAPLIFYFIPVTGTGSHTCTKCFHIAKCILHLKRLHVVSKTLLLYGEILYYNIERVIDMLMA